MSSELVISVYQNVITSKYRNFLVVLQFLIAVLEFSMGNFCANNFFLSIFYCGQFFLVFFSVQAIFLNDF